MSLPQWLLVFEHSYAAPVLSAVTSMWLFNVFLAVGVGAVILTMSRCSWRWSVVILSLLLRLLVAEDCRVELVSVTAADNSLTSVSFRTLFSCELYQLNNSALSLISKMKPFYPSVFEDNILQKKFHVY